MRGARIFFPVEEEVGDGPRAGGSYSEAFYLLVGYINVGEVGA